jgi:hypothetical protein
LAAKSSDQKIADSFALWCNGNTAPFGGVIHGSNPCGAATPRKTAFGARGSPSRVKRSFLRGYLPGVGLEIGNANVAEGDAAGEPEGEDVDVGEGETVGVGEGVGVGGGGIIFSQ